jgi:hypothetical protein
MSSLTRTLVHRANRYQSLSNFYRADRRRRSSREQDVGLWWRVGAHGAIYRAAWVRDTGELYVTRLGALQGDSGEVLVLGRTRSRDELDAALKGWQDVCPQPDSMTWLGHRTASLRAPEKPASLTGASDPQAGRAHHATRKRRAAAMKPSVGTLP